MLRYGLISELDASRGMARVNFNDDGIVSDWLPILVPKAMEDSFSILPDINEHVACLMDEHAENGVILGAMYSKDVKPNGGNKDKWRARFKDGTVIEYDRSAHKLFADVKGQVEVKAQGAVKVDGQSTVDVKATGAVKVETATTATVKAVAVTLDAPAVTVTGVLTVAQLAVSPGPGGTGNMAITGDIAVTGKLTTTGDIKTTGGDVEAPGGIKLTQHKHTGVQTGGGTSAIPVP